MKMEEILFLENELLQVRILPAFGGKITSLRSVRSGGEFLLPPLSGYSHVSPLASFDEGDGGGFDECLPSVASSGSLSGEAPVPDHGDLWRLMWHVDSCDQTVVLHADAVSRPLRLTRRAALSGPSLLLDYTLVNLSNSPATWLWSAHPLLQISAGDRILLPDEIDEVTVEYSATELFERNSSITWPNARSTSGNVIDLSEVAERDGMNALKLFARMGQSGWAALYRQGTGQGLILHFDTVALPFLGLWICSGAWPEDRARKQYTVALEPTTSSVDCLESAERNGTTRRLGGGERCEWRLELRLLGASAPLTFGEFCAMASSSSPEPVASS